MDLQSLMAAAVLPTNSVVAANNVLKGFLGNIVKSLQTYKGTK